MLNLKTCGMDDKELKEVIEQQLIDRFPDTKLYFLVHGDDDIYYVKEYDCWKERVYEDLEDEDGVLNVEKTAEKVIPIIRELYPNKDIRY